MMKRTMLGISVAAAMTIGGAAMAAGGTQWSYEGATGPESWGKLSQEFETCSKGKEQSPIDIAGAKPTSLENIKVNYKPSPLKIKNNGHTIQVDYAPGSSIDVGGTKFNLVQFHFHTPSEESIDGKRSPMVTHFVHKTDDGKLGVIGLLMNEGAESGPMKAVFDNMPKEAGEKTVEGVTINAADMLPKDLAYYNFAGSLTTPPCSEGVNWMVLAKPAEVSAAQVKAFKSIFSMNARPIQPVNGRVVKLDND